MKIKHYSDYEARQKTKRIKRKIKQIVNAAGTLVTLLIVITLCVMIAAIA